MSIAVNWMPSAGSYGNLMAGAGKSQATADYMSPFIEQYATQNFSAGEAEKRRLFESEQQRLQREWQAQQSQYDRELEWYKAAGQGGGGSSYMTAAPFSIAPYTMARVNDYRSLPGIVGARSNIM